MSLIESLLDAIIRLDGDTLILHVGEKPYVVTSSSSMNAFRGPLAWGQVELSTRVLAPEAVAGMLDQLLTPEQHQVLDELGAVDHELPATADRPAFTVIAARGGDDIWLEIRPVRQKAEAAVAAEPDPIVPEVPAQGPPPAVPPAAEPAVEETPARIWTPPPAASEPGHVWTPPAPAVPEAAVPTDAWGQPAPSVCQPPAPEDEPVPFELVPDVDQEQPDEREVAELLASAGWLESEAVPVALTPGDDPETIQLSAADSDSLPLLEEEGAPQPFQTIEVVQLEADEPAETTRPALVVPLARGLRDQPAPAAPAPASAPNLERLLRIAAARGASGLYLVAQSRPVLRVDGAMQPLDGEELLSAGDVEAFTLGLASESNREAVSRGDASEWFCDFPELGRLRCFTFSDHRGPGVIVRMLPARAISVEQLGLSKDIQALCDQPDGLVLVAGPRASGKSTLISALVDLVNRSRADHVVTIERQITFVHESRRSFVSQREVRGEAEAIASAVRAALREDPDVLVIEELRSPDVAAVALEAAESGRLVLAGLRADAAAPALERLVEQFAAERRPAVLTMLAASLRGVVSQVLLRKRSGGRMAARELLLNTPATAAVIADGKLSQLAAALESGRKLGNVALNDSLFALVRDGVIEAGEAWRRAHDREGLLTLLRREGIDTSFVERLA
jgi:twitching motility protein PilT